MTRQDFIPRPEEAERIASSIFRYPSGRHDELFLASPEKQVKACLKQTPDLYQMPPGSPA